MGKGDKKTKRGKIILGSYGNTRKRKKAKKYFAIVTEDKKIKIKDVELKIVKEVKEERIEITEPVTIAEEQTVEILDTTKTIEVETEKPKTIEAAREDIKVETVDAADTKIEVKTKKPKPKIPKKDKKIETVDTTDTKKVKKEKPNLHKAEKKSPQRRKDAKK